MKTLLPKSTQKKRNYKKEKLRAYCLNIYILSVKSCSIWVLVALFDHHQGMSACTAALKIDVFSPKLKGVCIALHSSTSPGAHLGKSQTGGIKIVEKFSKFFPFAQCLPCISNDFNLVLPEWGLKLNGKVIFPDFWWFSFGVNLNWRFKMKSF